MDSRAIVYILAFSKAVPRLKQRRANANAMPMRILKQPYDAVYTLHAIADATFLLPVLLVNLNANISSCSICTADFYKLS